MAFVKGQSGNPAGRPPRVVEDAQHSILLELFDEKAERAIVANMIRKAKSKLDPAAVNAATWLWDRKYGKVKEQVDHSGGLTVRVIYVDDAPSDE